MPTIDIKVKNGHKILSRELPYEWRSTVTKFLEKYPIRANIKIILQCSIAHWNATYRKRTKTVNTGNHEWLIPEDSSDTWKDSFHLIYVWGYAKVPLKTLLHELGHAHLEELEHIDSSEDFNAYGLYNTERNADKLAADILFDGELPMKLMSLSGLSKSDILKWEQRCNDE